MAAVRFLGVLAMFWIIGIVLGVLVGTHTVPGAALPALALAAVLAALDARDRQLAPLAV